VKAERPTSVPAILREILNEPVKVGGKSYKPLEIMIRNLVNQAMKGDLKAYTKLEQISEKAVASAAMQAQKWQTGVLAIPRALPRDLQLELVRRNQAKYREQTSDNPTEQDIAFEKLLNPPKPTDV
jgi:hypothetical protein